MNDNSERALEDLEEESADKQRHCGLILALIAPTLAYFALTLASNGAKMEALILLMVDAILIVGAITYIVAHKHSDWKRRESLKPKARPRPRPKKKPTQRPGLEIE